MGEWWGDGTEWNRSKRGRREKWCASTRLRWTGSVSQNHFRPGTNRGRGSGRDGTPGPLLSARRVEQGVVVLAVQHDPHEHLEPVGPDTLRRLVRPRGTYRTGYGVLKPGGPV